MPRFLSGHLCPETSGSFPGSVLGTSAARRGSSRAALVRHGARGLRGPAQGRREAAEEVAEPDCSCRLAALARGQRSRPRAGVQVRCALLGWRVRKRLDFTSSETRQNQGGEVESVPPGRRLSPVPGQPAEPGLAAVQCLLWAVAMPHAGVSVGRPRHRCG